MKHLVKFCIVSAFAGILSLGSYAQVSETATATATIITPISISLTTDMDFGNLAVNASAGTCVLATDGSRSATGGVTLPATAGSPAAAVFNVTGTAGCTYTIQLPAAAITLDDGSSHTMTLDTFVSNPSGTGTLTGGAESVSVGGTLHVGASQTAGVYTNTTDLTVTVNYN